MFTFIKEKIGHYRNVDRMPPEGSIKALPTKLWDFIWFFLRQIKGLVITMMSFEIMLAVGISTMLWYVGQMVEQGEYAAAMAWGGLAIILAWYAAEVILTALYDLVYNPFFGNVIRRQLFKYTAGQSLTYFQNDFAGRIATKIIQSAPRLRDAIRSAMGSVWFAASFTVSNIWFMSQASIWLMIPMLTWLGFYILTLCYFVPKVKETSASHSEDMSMLTGQVVDSLTNILPAKYFAQGKSEDQRVVKLLENHSKSFVKMTSTIWKMNTTIMIGNALLLISTAMICFWLIDQDTQAGVAALAMSMPMALQACFQSGWIMFEVSGIFENLGSVQEGIDTLAKPYSVKDKKGAAELKAAKGDASIDFSNVEFNYGSEDKTVLSDFSLHIPAGQKVGLVGRSGAGKSTITNLLARAYDVESGEIKIADQNIADLTQDSVRRNITIVTQDSYLFHRSILDNIRYGKPEASMEEVETAARKAYAADFIPSLEDGKGRRGYSAHVGERGVKLSGGQKQRISIARAILKDAPILILDEATSALDSESEHAIQQALEGIMEDKTVIAIAHRLSTLRQMDRIIVMDAGQIIEDGTHDELIKQNGHYANLWSMQSGGFLNTEKESAKAAE